ncbi:MAG: LysR family transcriptional regulator [Cyanobacteria bacterium J06628_6]
MSEIPPQVELRHLRYFVAVAQTLHFGKAAEQVGITQPVLSDQIRRLEQLLKVQLLYRTKRVVKLTAAGQVLLEEATQLLTQADVAVVRTRRAADGKLGSLTIGYTGPALYTVMPDIVRTFRDRNPDIHLSLDERCTSDQEAALLADELEVGFLHPPVDAALSLHPILRETMLLALPEDHPLASQPQISIKQLAKESFILFPREVGPNLYASILRLCAEAGFVPRVAQEVTPQPTMIGMVAAGMGIALVSASLQQIGRTGVVYRELVEPAPTLELAIAWKAAAPGPSQRPVLQNFLAVAQAWQAG